MMPEELITKYATCGHQSLSVTFYMLSDSMLDLTLASGRSPQSPEEWRQLMRELGDAARVPIIESERLLATQVGISGRQTLRVAPQPRWRADPICPTCDHVHEGREECGHYLGEGKFCHCSERGAA